MIRYFGQEEVRFIIDIQHINTDQANLIFDLHFFTNNRNFIEDRQVIGWINNQIELLKYIPQHPLLQRRIHWESQGWSPRRLAKHHIWTSRTGLSSYVKTSKTPEVRKEHSQQLFDQYVNTFLSALERLDVPLEEEGLDHQFFMTELNKKLLFGMFQGLICLPVILEGKMVGRFEKISSDQAD